LEGYSVCRRDDIEAIFYTMVETQGIPLEELSDYVEQPYDSNKPYTRGLWRVI
jgi:hypothetical protein